MSLDPGLVEPSSSDYVEWLKDYLYSLSTEIDVDILSTYILGILDCSDSTQSEITGEVQSLLSDYLVGEFHPKEAEDIVQRFLSSRTTVTQVESSAIQSLEERMRALVQADYENHIQSIHELPPVQPRERDVCTAAVLRQCGAPGYQDDSEGEQEAEIAMANAEFEAKQRLEIACGKTENRYDDLCTYVGSQSETESDFTDLEPAGPIPDKNILQPGTVQDALSLLNPSLFGSATASARVPAKPLTSGLHVLTTNRTAVASSISVRDRPPSGNNVIDLREPNRSGRKKKKTVALSKHHLRVGAKAEAKQLQQRTSHKPPTANSRNLLDQMDAFLVVDSDSSSVEAPSLLDAGRNHERVASTERAARQELADASATRRVNDDRTSRASKLDQLSKTKQAARQRVQKVERRC